MLDSSVTPLLWIIVILLALNGALIFWKLASIHDDLRALYAHLEVIRNAVSNAKQLPEKAKAAAVAEQV